MCKKIKVYIYATVDCPAVEEVNFCIHMEGYLWNRVKKASCTTYA